MECINEAPLRPSTNLGEQLITLHDFWDHWGFVPWKQGVFEGVSRRQRFVKGGFLGPIAEYGAWEAIVWAAGNQEEREVLWHSCTALPEVMTQRYLFLVDNPWSGRKIRSFAWGFKGYVEFYAYWPNFQAERKVKDLTGLVDLALTIEQRAATLQERRT